MASDHVNKMLSTKMVDPEDASDLLAYYTRWYAAALNDDPLPDPPKAQGASGSGTANTPDEIFQSMRDDGRLDRLRSALGGMSEDEKFQTIDAFIQAQSDDDGVQSGLAQKLIMELMP